MKRIAIAVAAVVTAVLLGPAAPAQATGVGALYVLGIMTVGAGQSYACLGGGTLDLTRCPQPIGNGDWVSAFTLSGTAVGGIGGTSKSGSGVVGVEAGTFNVNANGWVTGVCSPLWYAEMSGSIYPAIALGTKAKGRTFHAIMLNVGGPRAVLVGETDKGELLSGYFMVQPNVVDGSSCTNQGPKNFVQMGALTISAGDL